jgi:hypothetical protein
VLGAPAVADLDQPATYVRNALCVTRIETALAW